MNDIEIRIQAFSWLKEQVEIYNDILPRKVLQEGFSYNNIRIPLVAPNGIFKPQIMDLPLTITSITNGPYNDQEMNGYILYKYRGTNVQHRDNIGLRNAMVNNTPLIYLNGVLPGKYIAAWPAYIIGDSPENLTFKVVFDDISIPIEEKQGVADSSNPRREYITTTVKKRIHQQSFRERVLYAYNSQCSFCRLRHKELLDAAHIIPDSNPESKPTVDNGMALCKIHHAAYDRYFIGITPEYKIIVREDILNETDGPMLQHGLKNLNNLSIQLPKKNEDKPNKDFLDYRYQQFLQA